MSILPFPENGKPIRPLINAELCKGCELCAKFCPKGILKKGTTLNALGYAAIEIQAEGCVGCGNCFYICPEPGVLCIKRRQSIPATKPNEKKRSA